MAICRFNEYSDVYLWPAGNYYECSACSLGDGYVEEGRVLEHLLEHREAGHKVEDSSLERARMADDEDADYCGHMLENWAISKGLGPPHDD